MPSVVGLVLALVATPVVLVFGTPIGGLGVSLYPIARITLLAKSHPDPIGRVLGVAMATGDLGQSILPPSAGALAVGIAWQAGLGHVIPFVLAAEGPRAPRAW
jgi:hypothetical protein